MITEGRLYIETEAYVFVTVGIPSLFLSSLYCVSVYLLCLLLEAPDPVLTQPDIL